MDTSFDTDALLKGDDVRLLALSRGNQLSAFDDFQVVEAQAVTGCWYEAIVGPVVRRSQDRAEALLFAGPSVV